MRVLVPALLAAGLLAGCSSDAKIVAGTQQSVVVQFDGKDLTQAMERATAYCGTLGKQASLQGVAEKNNDSIATFSCV
ncbi:MAG TPA: hypothetical protein VF502_06855 [Stellaceae bacterium]